MPPLSQKVCRPGPVVEDTGEFFYFRVFAADALPGRGCAGSEPDRGTVIAGTFAAQAVDTVVVFVEFIVVFFIAYVVQDEQAGGHAHGQSKYIDK